MNDPTQRYTRPVDRINGSGALIGFSDTPMYLLSPQDADSPAYEFGWVPHNALDEAFKLTRDDNGLFVPFGEHQMYDVLETVYALTPLTPTSSSVLLSTVATACNITERTVRRYLNQLISENRVVSPVRGQFQRIPPS